MRKHCVSLLGAVLLAGCGGAADSGKLLDSTGSVCDEFAGYLKNGGDREQTVESMGKAVGNADERVQGAFKPLQATADGAGDVQAADDGFAQACFDAGWTG